MNSTLNYVPPVKTGLLTLGEIPSSYLVSMTYEEQLIWLCHFLENDIVPRMNEVITIVNNLDANLTVIAGKILDEKIKDGSLVVSLGMTYDDTNEELTFSIDSMSSTALIEELETLTTPSVEEV